MTSSSALLASGAAAALAALALGLASSGRPCVAWAGLAGLLAGGVIGLAVARRPPRS